MLSSEWLNTVPTFNFALWFLPIFFIAALVFPLLQLLRGNRVMYVGAVLALALLSLPFQALLPGRPVLAINVLPVALVLMACGYLLRTCAFGLRLRVWMVIALLAFSLTVAFVIPGNIADIRSYLYFPSALASFIVYLALARFLEGNRFLEYVGRNSLLLFGIQGLVAHTYTHTGIPELLSTGWDGLMLYAANLVYVMVVSVLVIAAYRAAKRLVVDGVGRVRRFMTTRKSRSAGGGQMQAGDRDTPGEPFTRHESSG